MVEPKYVNIQSFYIILQHDFLHVLTIMQNKPKLFDVYLSLI